MVCIRGLAVWVSDTTVDKRLANKSDGPRKAVVNPSRLSGDARLKVVRALRVKFQRSI